MDPLALVVLAVLLGLGAFLSFRWLRKLQALDYPGLEKKLYGSETTHLPLQQRKANADRARTKAAILVAGLVLAACILSWKALQAFIQ